MQKGRQVTRLLPAQARLNPWILRYVFLLTGPLSAAIVGIGPAGELVSDQSADRGTRHGPRHRPQIERSGAGLEVAVAASICERGAQHAANGSTDQRASRPLVSFAASECIRVPDQTLGRLGAQGLS